jgi:hypothetical protein
MITDVYSGSPDPDFSPIPDPGTRGPKGTGPRIRIRNTIAIFISVYASRLRNPDQAQAKKIAILRQLRLHLFEIYRRFATAERKKMKGWILLPLRKEENPFGSKLIRSSAILQNYIIVKAK